MSRPAIVVWAECVADVIGHLESRNLIAKSLIVIDALLSLSRNKKRIVMMCADVVLVMLALTVAHSLRANRFYLPFGDEIWLWLVAPLVALPVFVLCSAFTRPSSAILASARCGGCSRPSAFTPCLWGVVTFMSGLQLTPRSVVIINWLVSLLFVAGARMVARWILTYRGAGIPGRGDGIFAKMW